MSPSWRDDLRVGLCSDRLVVARRRRGWRGSLSRQIVPAADDPVAALKTISEHAAISVVLSNHFCRYAVLKSSPALKTERDWLAYAKHSLNATYGNESARWDMRVSPAGPHGERVACAVEAELIAGLRSLPGLRSIQPYLMSAFNARRNALAGRPAWLVIQEPGRLAIALVDGGWKVIRVRSADGQWHAQLASLLDREAAIDGGNGCERAIVCSEDEPPARAGRYQVEDLSLPRRAEASLRPYLMTLH